MLEANFARYSGELWSSQGKSFYVNEGALANLKEFTQRRKTMLSRHTFANMELKVFQCEYQYCHVVFKSCIGSHSSLHNPHILWVLCMIKHNTRGW
jgi:hypothetical protein